MHSKIQSGIYIVVNPAQHREEIIRQLSQIKDEKIAALQIWDHPDIAQIDEDLLRTIIQMFKGKAPILINNQWKLVERFAFDGVHFDEIPEDFDTITTEIGHDFIKGLTLHNDLTLVEKANQLNFDYLSFCAMFPSKTVNSCEIVQPETVKKCSKLTDMPLFLSGGITPDKINQLRELPFQGIAVVSGIMNAEHPEKVFEEYKSALNI